jgi:signal transduction histidine kinase
LASLRSDWVLSDQTAVADGLRALRLVAFVFLVIDVVSTLTGPSYGVFDLGPSGLLPAAQMTLVIAAVAAALWNRPRIAVTLSVVVAALVFTLGPSGEEVWLLVITAVTAAVRANRWQLAAVVVAQVGYAVGFGFDVERRNVGAGLHAGLITLAFSAAAFAGGLVARNLLRARDGRRLRVAELERQAAQLRATERARLADDLQAVVTDGLLTIGQQIEAVARRPADLANLRQGLVRIDAQSRLLLTELRALLELFRRDPDLEDLAGTRVPRSGGRRWLELVTARHVRIATAVIFGLLAVQVAVHHADSLGDTGVLVHVTGLLACATAIWRRLVGAILAGAALVIALVLGEPSFWIALPAALLCLIGTLQSRPGRSWLVIIAMAAYAGLLALTDTVDPVAHVMLVGYSGFLAVAVGLAARHFHEARTYALRRMIDLRRERVQVEAEERNAVARELHDVLAHQLSMTTMQVMATSLSQNPEALVETLAKVRRSTDEAQHELSTLLYAMRGPVAENARPTPLITPLASAEVFARRLAESGYQPVLDLDPAADALDATTQRTLNRIMQEAATNILRYSPAGTACHYVLAVDTRQVRLSISSQLAAHESKSDLSLGWGLRGIGERVDLSGGTFKAGPDGGQWTVAVTLPVVTGAVDEPAPCLPAVGHAGASGAVARRRETSPSVAH